MKRQTKRQTKRQLKGGSITDVIAPIANRAVAVSKIYKGDISGFKSLLPNLSDSMDQLNPLSDDFNPELYNMLTKDEQNQVQFDIMRTKTSPLNIIPFIGLFQDTREATAEFLDMRHPELLETAINRYNAKVQADNELQAIQEQAYEDQLKQQEKQQEEDRFKDIIKQEFLQQSIENQKYNDFQSAPHTIIPTTATPIDPTRGRGLVGRGLLEEGTYFQSDLHNYIIRRRQFDDDYDIVKY